MTYIVRGKEYRRHTDACRAAEKRSHVLPVHLRTSSGGTALYWRGRYCGRRFTDLFRRKGGA